MEHVHPIPPETIVPFEAKEPDWKSLYYSLALHIARADSHLLNGNKVSAESHISAANKSIQETEEVMRMSRSILAVMTTPDTTH
jgi:hypothetical protein